MIKLEMSQLKVALIQMNAGNHYQQNIDHALSATQSAIKNGADFILLPEMFHYRGEGRQAESIPGPTTTLFQTLARTHQVHILLGSITEKTEETDQFYNTSILIDPQGTVQNTYRKMNLFDAHFGDDRTIKESRHYIPGDSPQMAEVQNFNMGMSICYDIRFPDLFQHYVKNNAHILTIPASFTSPTGEAHWEVLCRSRAIETQCYVLAPNQMGIGSGGVDTYGNSLIIDPWGTIISRGSSDQEEILYATLDMAVIKRIRHQFPFYQLS